jgi:two-component system KDP operon response regulator KdpE
MALTAPQRRSTVRLNAMDSAPVKTTVLVVDDEVQIRRLIRACLEGAGYGVEEAATGEEGISAAIQVQPGIVILDLGLPDVDGMLVLRRLREWTNAPIIVLSVRDGDADKVTALDDGANDYMTKPFSTMELLARLRVAQRNRQPDVKSTIFASGPLHVDLVARTVKLYGRELKLARTEYALLRLFAQHAGRVLTHGQLLREIWDLDDVEKTGRLRVYVASLREKIEIDPTRPQLLVTIPGVGYRLEQKEAVV